MYLEVLQKSLSDQNEIVILNDKDEEPLKIKDFTKDELLQETEQSRQNLQMKVQKMAIFLIDKIREQKTEQEDMIEAIQENYAMPDILKRSLIVRIQKQILRNNPKMEDLERRLMRQIQKNSDQEITKDNLEKFIMNEIKKEHKIQQETGIQKSDQIEHKFVFDKDIKYPGQEEDEEAVEEWFSQQNMILTNDQEKLDNEEFISQRKIWQKQKIKKQKKEEEEYLKMFEQIEAYEKKHGISFDDKGGDSESKDKDRRMVRKYEIYQQEEGQDKELREVLKEKEKEMKNMAFLFEDHHEYLLEQHEGIIFKC